MPVVRIWLAVVAAGTLIAGCNGAGDSPAPAGQSATATTRSTQFVAFGDAGNFDGVPPQASGTTNGKPWKDLLDATVCKHGVDLFIAGHDHDLEWLKPVQTCGKTHFIVSGAAEGPRPFRPGGKQNETYWQRDDTLGFFWLKLEEDRFTAAAYTLDANRLLPKDAQGRPVPAFEQTVARVP